MSNDDTSQQRPERSEQAATATAAPALLAGGAFADVLLDQLPDAGICRLGLNGEVQYWHPSATRLLGHDAEQMRGRPLATLYPEEERSQARPHRALFAASARGRHQHSAALLARSGNRQPCLLDIRCIYDERDDASGFAVLLRSARVYGAPERAPDTEAPHEYYLHLLNLVERMGDIAWLALDLNGRIAYANVSAARRIGRAQERIVGRMLADLVAPGEQQPLIGLLHRAVRSREGIEIEGRLLVAPDGDEADPETDPNDAENGDAPLALWLKPLFVPGDRLAGFSVLLIVEQTAEAAAAQATAEHTAAAAHAIEQNWMMAAAHDLREPLRKMLAFSELLQRAEAPRMSDDGRRHLDAMQGAASRMQALVTSLARLARIEGHQLYFEEVDLAQVVADVQADLQLLIDERDARIETQALPVVHGEAAQLREMFQNLVENSIRYRRAGVPPTIRIAGDAEQQGPPHLITYRDNASGIDPDQLEHVFSPFRRGHSSSADPGSGIGLTLCQRICWRHGGDIVISDSGPTGTLFTIRLGEAHDRRRDDIL